MFLKYPFQRGYLIQIEIPCMCYTIVLCLCISQLVNRLLTFSNFICQTDCRRIPTFQYDMFPNSYPTMHIVHPRQIHTLYTSRIPGLVLSKISICESGMQRYCCFFHQNIWLCGVSDWTIPKCNNWSQWYGKELYCLCNMLGAWGKDRTFGPCPAGGGLH